MTQESQAPHSAGWPAMSLEQAHARLTSDGMPYEMEEVTIGGQRLRV